MNEYTVAVGMVSSLLALAGFPFMWSSNARHMMTGVLLAVPFVAFMIAFMFVVRH